jgi:hypothetical protein
MTLPIIGQPGAIIKFYRDSDSPNAFLALLQTVKAGLSLETELHLFEQPLKQLASYLGAERARPDHA